eukprot:8892887-Alexandrium_andersonii.AAC.1
MPARCQGAASAGVSPISPSSEASTRSLGMTRLSTSPGQEPTRRPLRRSLRGSTHPSGLGAALVATRDIL